MKLLSVVSLCLLFIYNGRAQSAKGVESCDGSTYEMGVCLSKIYDRVDRELNAAFQLALKGLTRRHLENLRTAERRWTSYRDAQCKAQYDLFGGGTGGPLENLACLIDLTERRTAELREVYLHDK
jgi:uncharacterized protein YecT (DUF1311 family)